MSAGDPFGIDVQLGERTVRIVPQRKAYLRRQLGQFASKLTEEGVELDTDSIEGALNSIDEYLYEFLSIFAPDLPELMPRWEWDGYASATAAEADQYDEDADKSPTWPQTFEACKATVTVNDFNWLKMIGGLIGPDFLRGQLRMALASWAAARADDAKRTTNGNSSSQSGDSVSERSKTTDPTSAAELTPATSA